MVSLTYKHDQWTILQKGVLFMWKMDLMVPEYAYLYGFMQADGGLYEGTRNRGKATIHIATRDRHILEEFQKIVPFYSSISDRVRDTNFKKNFASSCWGVYALEFRSALKENGFTVGAKSFIQESPQCEFSEIDYYRGLIDGDGSLGVTGQGLPFLSLVTCSEAVAYDYISFLEGILDWRKTTSRNKRDGAFNIVVYNEDCQAVASKLYYKGCLALERKSKKKDVVLNWKRPSSLKKRKSRYKRWDAEQDEYILTHSKEESMKHLTRTRKSVIMRLWKLKKELRAQEDLVEIVVELSPLAVVKG